MPRTVMMMAAAISALAAFAAAPRNAEIWYDTNGHVVNAHGGGVIEWEGRYYLYGEHKIYGEGGQRAHAGFHMYSSDDMKSWHDEGLVLKVSYDPASDIRDGSIMERPKIVHCAKTGEFVMYFHLERGYIYYTDARVGIAVADSVTGPYRFVRSTKTTPGTYPQNAADWEKTPETLEKALREVSADPATGLMHAADYELIYPVHIQCGQDSRDMTLFVDDDGKAYLIHSSEYNSTLHIDELTDDYLDFTGRWWRTMEKEWTEAPAVCKFGGWYYLIGSGCTGWAPNTARYYRARAVTGPWERVGNPLEGVNPVNGLGAEITWGGQSNYILKVSDSLYLAMFDIWCPENIIDSRLIWVPIEFDDGTMKILWKDQWQN